VPRGCPVATRCNWRKRFEIMVSAAGFEPATHALKGAPTYSQTTTCTSSLLHARFKRIKQIRAGQSSRCPEGAQNPTLRINHSGSRGIVERISSASAPRYMPVATCEVHPNLNTDRFRRDQDLLRGSTKNIQFRRANSLFHLRRCIGQF
jgi:hypothetical protein